MWFKKYFADLLSIKSLLNRVGGWVWSICKQFRRKYCFRYRFRLGKALLLLLVFVLSLSGLASLGCVRGTQPIGWSGGVIADGTLFVGSKDGQLVSINLADGSRQ